MSGMALSAPILALGEIGSLGELESISVGVGIRGLHKKPTRLLVSLTSDAVRTPPRA